MKHVGKMKNNNAPVVVVFRTLPGEPNSCLVVGTQGLAPTYHDALMSLIETPEAQDSFELGTILGVRRFPDNSTVLPWLHSQKLLIKVSTNDVIMTFSPQQTIQLNELNNLIADQKKVKVEELAYIGNPGAKVEPETIATVKDVETKAEPEILDDTTLAKRLRSQADAMFKEAQTLRKQADELDPPVTKKATSKKAQVA